MAYKKFIDELNLTEKLEEIYFRIRCEQGVAQLLSSGAVDS